MNVSFTPTEDPCPKCGHHLWLTPFMKGDRPAAFCTECVRVARWVERMKFEPKIVGREEEAAS